MTRRDVLKAAAGLGLSFALPALDLRAAERRGRERAKSLITIWLAGGPSQLETWDPHPRGNVGETCGAIATAVPGLEIAEFFPATAEQMGSLSVIRSLVSKEGDHQRGTYFLKTGYRPEAGLPKPHPAVGAVVAHEFHDPDAAIPQYVSLGPSQWPGRGGYLGDHFDALKVFDPGRSLQNMQRRVNEERQERRLQNLDVISQTFRAGRGSRVDETLHQETIRRALRMMSSEQLRAFDIEDEPKSVLERYGDTSFGRGCLVARRLLEEGVRSIEVTLDGFDSHANNLESHRENAAILDPALASLIRDLVERGLWDSTVLLCLGEFGRTPQVNPLGGRDHWPIGFSCLIGGGGLRAGEVIGATDPQGKDKDPQDPVQVQDLYATVLKALDIDGAKEIVTSIGRPIALCKGTPLRRLLET